MENNALLEKVLTTPMNEDLRTDLVRFLFNKSGRIVKGIPRLADCPRSLNYGEIYERMTAVAGGTGASVARLLGISPQAYNNQRARGIISSKSIIEFHRKTGVSLDWLIGSWDGSSAVNLDQTNFSAEETAHHPEQKYLSLVEVYDQHSGNVDLKWCLSKKQKCLDDNNLPLPDDFGVLLALIIRYKDQSGTPDKVKHAKKRHFQVRKVLAYVVGESQIIRRLDTKAKKLTEEFQSDILERAGKTEFRLYSAKYDCLKIFKILADHNGLKMVEPAHQTIAWDYLIGPGSISPRDWVLEKLAEYNKMHGPRGASASDPIKPLKSAWNSALTYKKKGNVARVVGASCQ